MRRVYNNFEPSIDESGIIDLTVSFDGSWMKRGRTSSYGIGCVIEVLTGLVIDFGIFSVYCQSCAYATTRCGSRDTSEFKAWQETHEGCNCNYSGSFGGMEVEAAEMLWGSSVDRLNFRYTTILSDDDSWSYKRLCDLQPCGPDVTIEKEECVNHVAKRMGTALNKLASEGKKAGNILGGSGHGRLTQNTIKNLKKYNGRAIRTHPGDPEPGAHIDKVGTPLSKEPR